MSRTKMPELDGKVALVTGAGRGIGKAIAIAFARAGASLAVVSRTESEINQTGRELHSLNVPALVGAVDVSNLVEVRGFVNKILDRHDRIDILVNSAGVLGPVGPMSENDVQSWTRTLMINLMGTYHCSTCVLPTMLRQHSGKIINLLGGGATLPYPRFSAYATSKAAVAGLTQTLAEELREENIQVNAVAPGLVNTKLQDEILAAGERAGQKALAKAREAKEKGAVSPNEAASLAVFLASSDSDGLTGRILSAAWDNWRSLLVPKALKELVESEYYTLRRIDGMFFVPKGAPR